MRASDHVVTLLEREQELEELDAALGEVQRERGQIVLIEAPAGLGKSSLLWRTFDTAAGMGFTCLRARGSELESDFPYGCVRQLLEPLVTRISSATRNRLFEDAAALALPLFAPGGVSQVSIATDGAFATLYGLYWLLNNLARDRPVALCVDDLQWCDVESLRLLSYLAPRLDGLPLAVFASVRSREHITTDLTRILTAPEVKILRPAPLSIAATARLCERQFGVTVAHDFAAACQGATGGNPFFLQTLLREAKELRFLTAADEAARVRRIGPAAVARAVLLRLAAAPAAATAVVHAIAVLGDAASVVDVARLAELSEQQAAQAADLLVELAILKQAEALEFAHPIVRHAIYESIGTHERARAHARAARILTVRGAADERVAAQILKTEPAGEVARVEPLRRVATRALVQGAPAAALAWLTRALAEPPTPESRPEVLLELGSAQLRLGMPQAVEHLTEAMAGIQQPMLFAVAARQLANALNMSGDAERAVAALESSIVSVESCDREMALILEAELAAKAQQASHGTRIKVALRLARYTDLRGETPAERLVLASLAFEQARASESERAAVECIEHALAGGGLFGQQPDVVGPFYALVIGLLATDALDLALSCIERALLEARARGSIPALAFLIAHRGWFYLRGGEIALAEADARAALDLMKAHDIRLGHGFALALLLEALIERGIKRDIALY